MSVSVDRVSEVRPPFGDANERLFSDSSSRPAASAQAERSAVLGGLVELAQVREMERTAGKCTSRETKSRDDLESTA
jgi:hypothetical protein